MRIFLMAATLLLASCGPPFLTAEEEGAPFVIRKLPFSENQTDELVQFAEGFGAAEGMDVSTSGGVGDIGVALEKGTLTIFANNAATPTQLFVTANKRSPAEVPSPEERALAARFLTGLEDTLH